MPAGDAPFDRRRFVATLPAASLAPRLAWPQQLPAILTTLPDSHGPTIPADFTGLSYESAQLANPEFFSPRNKALTISSGSSLFPAISVLAAAPASSPRIPTLTRRGPPFEVFGPDTSKTVKGGTITTALALRNLRGFLDATNWSCLYGLNLGQGTRENAAAEAAAAHRILGPRLLALQGRNPNKRAYTDA